MKLLCDNGADINIQDNDGRTALWQTASKGDKAMLLVLLHLKADPNISHNLSISPLHIALYILLFISFIYFIYFIIFLGEKDIQILH